MPLTFTVDAAKRIRDAVRRVEGTPGGAPGPNPNPDQLPPETLFALVPAGGIPARSGTTLGSALCDIYRDAPQSFGSTTRVLQPVNDTGTQRQLTIQNANTTLIDVGDGTRYIPITRTKHGAWIPFPGCA